MRSASRTPRDWGDENWRQGWNGWQAQQAQQAQSSSSWGWKDWKDRSEDRWAERRWKWDDAARRKTTSEEQAAAAASPSPSEELLPEPWYVDAHDLTLHPRGQHSFTMIIPPGLGIARSLKPNEKDPVGPVLDSQSLLQELFPGSGWPSIFRRVLGLRLCLEEEGSNWSRRPLRRSQLHHAAVMTWTQLPVLHALCAKTSLLPEAKLRGHVCVQSRTRFWLRSRDGGKHVLGQLAPPGRMVEPKGTRGTASSFTRVALLEDSENQEEVEVVSDLIGNSAMVVPLGADLATPRRVDARCLRAVNCWSSSVWVERLMAAASVDRGEEFFGTVDQLAVAEVMPAFTSRLAMSTTTRTLAGIHQSRRGCKQRQEICWKLCSRFFDLDLANGLLEQSYAAQRSLLGDPWES